MSRNAVSVRRGGNDRGFALVEIILGIGVLALVGLVVVQMFIAAANTQNKARDLDNAVTEAQSAAEFLRATGEMHDRHYDRDWNRAENPDSDGFSLEVTVREIYPPVLVVRVYKNSPYPAQPDGRPLIFELIGGVEQ